jgi:hypothetical protein
MSIDYNIPNTVYEKLLFEICKKYDEKFKRLKFIADHVPENRYELPKTVNDSVCLKMGMMVYIKKAVGDPFDIEYTVEFNMNAKSFINFINTYMKKHYYIKFDYENYTYKDEFLNILAKYISEKYSINAKIHRNGGYIQYNIIVWMCPKTRIIYIN